MSTPRCFVTGGNGFIGSHLVEALLAERCTVRALARDPGRLRWLPREGVTVVAGDLDDHDALRRGAEGADAVYHLAALTKAPTDRVMFHANLRGTENVARASIEVASHARFLFLSSQAAAGPSDGGLPVSEGSAPAPRSGYGRSKLEAERMLGELSGSMRLTIVRPPAVYGPRDEAFLTLFRLAARTGLLPLPRGAKRISMIHVGDLVAGMRLVMERGSGVYYLTDGIAHELVHVLEAIASAVGRRTRFVPLSSRGFVLLARLSELASRALGRTPPLTRDRASEATATEWVCSDARARDELGFRSRWGLIDGMRQTAAWYRSEGLLR